MRGYVLFAVFVFLLAILISYPVSAQQDESSPGQTDKQRDKSDDSARQAEESSSKDTRVDLSPPANDQKNHPQSGAAMVDAEDSASDVQEMHPWDPHKAAKDVEVGDFYFKRKNYKAALERYKDALIYKPNDAVANFRLAECLEKTGSPSDAVTYYREYLKILPHGPLAPDAEKELERLKADSSKASTAP